MKSIMSFIFLTFACFLANIDNALASQYGGVYVSPMQSAIIGTMKYIALIFFAFMIYILWKLLKKTTFLITKKVNDSANKSQNEKNIEEDLPQPNSDKFEFNANEEKSNSINTPSKTIEIQNIATLIKSAELIKLRVIFGLVLFVSILSAGLYIGYRNESLSQECIEESWRASRIAYSLGNARSELDKMHNRIFGYALYRDLRILDSSISYLDSFKKIIEEVRKYTSEQDRVLVEAILNDEREYRNLFNALTGDTTNSNFDKARTLYGLLNESISILEDENSKYLMSNFSLSSGVSDQNVELILYFTIISACISICMFVYIIFSIISLIRKLNNTSLPERTQ